ncbi:hypothetical protein [Pontivivens ytuae]|uniref:Uncharacterized protein n=1 Tax=Pontivivens ytuae TaxID=2789856 RepID=A0A7S9LUA6_9RHOB|nr:hypothetical protein [Pontivivens ytuae]QPH55135.1 hypothetical protein I0K15_05145 [Pontivivens ytuae]
MRLLRLALAGLVAAPALAQGPQADVPPLPPFPQACEGPDCAEPKILPYNRRTPNEIGDADDLISDRAATLPDAGVDFDPDAVGAQRNLLLQRIGRDRPRNRVGHN